MSLARAQVPSAHPSREAFKESRVTTEQFDPRRRLLRPARRRGSVGGTPRNLGRRRGESSWVTLAEAHAWFGRLELGPGVAGQPGLGGRTQPQLTSAAVRAPC